MNIRFFTAAIFLCLAAVSFRISAQQAIPLQNQSTPSAIGTEHPQVEVVEIRRGGALPAEIHRPAGKFILLVVNRTHDPAASFAIDPASVGEGVIGPNPLLHLASGAASTKHRLAGMVDLPAGQFHLKAASTGKILCRITIE
jgi:hypothetical protein